MQDGRKNRLKEGEKMHIIIGIDIGGTKCAVSFAREEVDHIKFLDKVRVPTETESFQKAIENLTGIMEAKLKEHPEWELCAIGISCGGPLDAENGVIQAPPNLPKWVDADIFTPLKRKFGVPVMIQNDADACALAEWTLGAGRGCRNMIFLTFGTGMGAGLILDNRLYTGTTGMAGEVGHIRLEATGPYGYGKQGSFEGFCSGGGIANLGREMAREALQKGTPPLFCRSQEELEGINSKKIADAMEQGDQLARQIFDIVACHLGKGLSVLIDILNPQVIVIGGIFARQQDVLRQRMWEMIRQEALPASGRACQILPASLGEMIGDYAAVTVGIKAYRDLYRSEEKDPIPLIHAG